MFQSNTAPTSMRHTATYDMPNGSIMTATNGGGNFLATQQNKFGMSAQAASAMKSSISTKAATTKQATLEAGQSYISEAAALSNNLATYQTGQSTSTSVGSQSSKGSSGTSSSGTRTLLSHANKAGISSEFREQNAAKVMAFAQLAMKQPSILQMINPVDARAALQMDGTSQAAFNEAWKKATDYAESNDFSSDLKSSVDGAQKDLAGKTDDSSKQLSSSITGGVQNTQKAGNNYSAKLAESNRWEQADERTDDQSFSFSQNASGLLRQAMHDKYGSRQGDALLQQADAGDFNSMQQVAQTAKELADSKGLEIAGVKDASSDGAVTRANEQNRESVTTQRQVQTAGQQNSDEARNLAEKNDVPAPKTVEKGADDVIAESNQLQADVATGIATGEETVTLNGESVKLETKPMTDGNRSVGGTAMANFAEEGIGIFTDGAAAMGDGGSLFLSKGTDIVSDLINKGTAQNERPPTQFNKAESVELTDSPDGPKGGAPYRPKDLSEEAPEVPDDEK